MSDPANPDPVLGTALRYAAGDLTATDAEAFETTLADSQPARDALAEAVRLSAAASGVPLPAADPLFKQAVAERVRPTWFTKLFPRRPYRGHPAVWAGVGGGCAAAVVLLMNANPPAPVVVRAPGEINVMSLSAPPLEPLGSVEAPPTAASPATRPAGHPRLNPMGMEPKPGVAANVEPTPDPMLPTVPMPLPVPLPPAPLPAANAVAEGPDAPLPPGAPKIGMM